MFTRDCDVRTEIYSKRAHDEYKWIGGSEMPIISMTLLLLENLILLLAMCTAKDIVRIAKPQSVAITSILCINLLLIAFNMFMYMETIGPNTSFGSFQQYHIMGSYFGCSVMTLLALVPLKTNNHNVMGCFLKRWCLPVLIIQTVIIEIILFITYLMLL